MADVCIEVMESIRLDGSDRRLLLTNIGHAYGVAVVEGVAYWTDWRTKSLWKADVTNNSTTGMESRQLIIDRLDGLMDIHAASLMTRHPTHCESVSLHPTLH